ncbi:hypothetical protein RA307_04735 [Xanthobacteraceae bacterium Astr-EGSB]|uniref:hypothetical protein n=1 Tax=Astrobacterium formosum TaxID=3069710 RepID=UPI0027B6E219|nr:hypothetical protein [Xanthobacteraceae bacterium Astr-EGSB]
MGLFSIFSGDDAEEAARLKAQGIERGYTDATSSLKAGKTSADQRYDAALVPFTSLYSTGMTGVNSYSDAMGLNGAEGSARAVAAFKSNPGYTSMLDSGLSAVDRGAAARGTLSSGGTIAAEQKYGSDLANQTWQQYLNGYSPYFTLAGQGASGIGSVNTTAAGTEYQAGRDQASYDWQRGTGVGNAEAEGAMADYNASANAWGAIFKGLDIGAKVLGYSTGKGK